MHLSTGCRPPSNAKKKKKTTKLNSSLIANKCVAAAHRFTAAVQNHAERQTSLSLSLSLMMDDGIQFIPFPILTGSNNSA